MTTMTIALVPVAPCILARVVGDRRVAKPVSRAAVLGQPVDVLQQTLLETAASQAPLTALAILQGTAAQGSAAIRTTFAWVTPILGALRQRAGLGQLAVVHLPVVAPLEVRALPPTASWARSIAPVSRQASALARSYARLEFALVPCPLQEEPPPRAGRVQWAAQAARCQLVEQAARCQLVEQAAQFQPVELLQRAARCQQAARLQRAARCQQVELLQRAARCQRVARVPRVGLLPPAEALS
jgi:hypothetical protein